MTLVDPPFTSRRLDRRVGTAHSARPRASRRGDTADHQERCPVERLAIEAAKALRGYYSLIKPHERQNAAAATLPYLKDEIFKSVAGGPTHTAVRDRLRRRIYGLAEAAASMRARSRKGALFQIYLAANAACFASGNIPSNEMVPMDLDYLRETEAKAEDLLSSALAVLELDADEDLRLLRGWFFDSTDQDLLTGDSVIAAVQAQSAH